MFHEAICKFPTVNISKLNFWLVICIDKNFIWTNLKIIVSIFRFFYTLRLLYLSQILSYHNKPCINGKRIYSAFRCINLHFKKCTHMTALCSRFTFICKLKRFKCGGTWALTVHYSSELLKQIQVLVSLWTFDCSSRSWRRQGFSHSLPRGILLISSSPARCTPWSLIQSQHSSYSRRGWWMAYALHWLAWLHSDWSWLCGVTINCVIQPEFIRTNTLTVHTNMKSCYKCAKM